MNEIMNIIITSAEGSFLQVGVFVGAVLLLFGVINYKMEGRFIEKIEKSKKIQPILGALLGLTPGCGGAIFVMPMYIRGTVSFGTVVATLIATMGDAAFVMIAAMPDKFILVSVLSLLIAIITGYIVDYFKIGETLLKNRRAISKEQANKVHEPVSEALTDYEYGIYQSTGKMEKLDMHIGHAEGDEIDLLLHHADGEDHMGFGYKLTHGILYKMFWVITTIGLVLGIMLLMQIDVNTLAIPNLGLLVGVGGTVLSIVYMIIDKKLIRDDTHEEEESKIFSLKETLIHNAGETAFVNTWVFVAYLVYELGLHFAGGESVLLGLMASAGLYAVILGAIVGLVPGCGPQILFVAMYTKGMLPFAALLANAISQDGDALFPLLILDRKSSLWATVITTVPALLFGVLYYYMEIGLF